MNAWAPGLRLSRLTLRRLRRLIQKHRITAGIAVPNWDRHQRAGCSVY